MSLGVIFSKLSGLKLWVLAHFPKTFLEKGAATEVLKQVGNP